MSADQRPAIRSTLKAGVWNELSALRKVAISMEKPMSSKFSVGDRVQHLLTKTMHYGTVEHVDHEHVRVRWDDGQIGNLFFDDKTTARVRNLQKLPTKGASEGEK